MALTFWQLFALKIIVATALAFCLAWRTKDAQRAYQRAVLGSLLVVFVPSCAPLFQSNPVYANQAAEEFFSR